MDNLEIKQPETPSFKESMNFNPEEIQKIAETIFPEERSSVINEAVKFYTDQNRLESSQKLMLAPANAIETVIKFGISLFDKKTYESLKQAIEMMSDKNARNLLVQGFKKGWNNLDGTEKTAFLTEFIFSTLVVYGGIQKLAGVIPADKLEMLNQTLQNKKMLGALAEAVGKTGKFIAASPLDDAAIIGGSVASKLTGH